MIFKKLIFKKHGAKEVEGQTETDTEYATRKLRELGSRLNDNLKREIADIQPLDGSFEDRLQAFNAVLDQLTQQDKHVGSRWMPLKDIFSNVKRYGEDVVVAAAISERVEWGVV